MGEILLLDVGLVVLFVGSRAGPFDAPVAAQEVGFDNFVEEFAAVIAVESEHRKGQAFFDPLKAYAHFAAAITPERCQLSPTAMEVGECQAPEERSAAASSAMRDGVGFEPTRLVEGLRAARLLAGLPDPDDDGLFCLGVGRLGTSSSRLFPRLTFPLRAFIACLRLTSSIIALRPARFRFGYRARQLSKYSVLLF